MNGNTCSDCWYWSNGNPDDDSITRLGDCSCPKFRGGYHLIPEDIALDEVHVENAQGWMFQTGPMFGCIHWNPDAEPDKG